jgi:hypothetical protein
VPLDLVGVLRQNPRATGKKGIRIPIPATKLAKQQSQRIAGVSFDAGIEPDNINDLTFRFKSPATTLTS